MDFKGLDKKVKKAISENINEVPQGVNERIDKTLRDLDKKKKSNKTQKVIMVAGIVLCVGAMGIGTTVIAKGSFEKDIIFDKLGYEDKIKDYTINLGESKKNGETIVTLEDVVFDGYRALISYRISGEEYNLLDREVGVFEASFNGNKVKEGFMGWGHSIRMGDSQLVTVEIPLSEYEVNGKRVGYVEEGKLNVSLGDIEKRWTFDIDISNKNIKEDIKKYPVNVDINDGKIKEVVVTPLKVYLMGEGFKDYSYDLYLKDKKGIYERTGNGQSLREDGTFILEYENKFKDLSEIKLARVKGRENEFKKVYLEKTKDGFKQTGSKDIQIIDIKNENGRTIIKFKRKNKDIGLNYFEISYEKHPYFEQVTNYIDGERGELVLLNGQLEEGKKYEFEIIETIEKVEEEILLVRNVNN